VEKRTVGSIELIALVDNIQTYPATAIYHEAGSALHRYSAYCDDSGGVALNFGCFLIRDGTTTILVDTGYGAAAGGRLFQELEAANVALDSIDIVAFTHLHEDHTAGNLDDNGQPRFGRARYLVPQADWDHYSSESPPPASFERDIAALRAAGRVDLFSGERSLSGSVTAVPTPGHTPGHTSYAITSGGEHGYVLGDVVLTCIDAEEPGLVTAFDWDHAMASATRKKVIAKLAAKKALVGASHLPSPGLGRFTSAGEGARWEPS